MRTYIIRIKCKTIINTISYKSLDNTTYKWYYDWSEYAFKWQGDEKVV